MADTKGTGRRTAGGEQRSDAERLDVSNLGRLVRERRGKLSIRQAADEAGVSFSTLSRVEGGGQPDLSTFTALCAWLGVEAGQFFLQVSARQATPLDEAVAHLQTDPRLTSAAADKLSSFLRDMYEALALEPQSDRPVIACHLRAASVMRPGVPSRLASLLEDMHRELDHQVSAGSL